MRKNQIDDDCILLTCSLNIQLTCAALNRLRNGLGVRRKDFKLQAMPVGDLCLVNKEVTSMDCAKKSNRR